MIIIKQFCQKIIEMKTFLSEAFLLGNLFLSNLYLIVTTNPQNQYFSPSFILSLKTPFVMFS